jgi:hypothetical protein
VQVHVFKAKSKVPLRNDVGSVVHPTSTVWVCRTDLVQPSRESKSRMSSASPWTYVLLKGGTTIRWRQHNHPPT